MSTLAKPDPGSPPPEEAQESAYPRTWLWEEDGNLAAGIFVRFDAGPTKEFGRKPILVLRIAGEERSVWLLGDALYNKFRSELAERPGRKLALGERIVVERLGGKVSQTGRTYMNYRVLFPDRPEPDTDTLFGLGPAPAANDKPEATETPSPDDGRYDGIPF